MLQKSVNAVTLNSFSGYEMYTPSVTKWAGPTLFVMWIRSNTCSAADSLWRSAFWLIAASLTLSHREASTSLPQFPSKTVRGTKANTLCLNQHLHAHHCTAGLFVSLQWMVLRFLWPGGKWIEHLASCVPGSEHLTAGTGSNVWTVDSQCDDGRSMCLVT